MVTIALLAVLLGGLLARSAARSEIETLIDVQILDTEVDAVESHRADNGTWDGVLPLLEEIDADAEVRLILSTDSFEVISDTRPDEDVPNLELLPLYELTDGDQFAYLFTFDREFQATGDADPLAGLDRKLLFAALAAIVVAGLVAVVLARRLTGPVGSLVGAVRQMSEGELGVRAEVRRSDELGELGTAFNDMASGLERAEANRRSMVADTAHELRTPLANLRGHLEAIDDGVIEADQPTIRALLGDVDRLARVVDDLQSLALAQSGELTLVMEELDVGDLLRGAIAAHTSAARAAQVELTLVPPAAPVTILGDRDRLGQVLGNLVSNALRYATKVVLSAELGRGQTVVLSVADDGPGIPVEERHQVFERFHRIDPSRSRETGGTGLGLAIVAQLVHAHGGEVGVATSPSGGARLDVTLPTLAGQA